MWQLSQFCDIIPKTPKLLHFCAAALGSGATWGSLSELTLATLAAVTNPGVGGTAATGGAARPRTTFADSKHLPPPACHCEHKYAKTQRQIEEDKVAQKYPPNCLLNIC